MTLRLAACVLVAAELLAAPAVAQVRPSGSVGFLILVARADSQPRIVIPKSAAELNSLAPEYRVYEESRPLEVRFIIDDNTDTQLLVNQPRLREQFKFRLDSGGGEVPIKVEWSERIFVYGSDEMVAVGPADVVPLQPRQHVEWTVTLRPVNGQRFDPGWYLLSWSAVTPGSALEILNAGTWTGPVSGAGIFGTGAKALLHIREAASPAEVARRHLHDAYQFRRRQEFENALAAYARATEAQPRNVTALLGLADIQLSLGRFRDAIPNYEAVLESNNEMIAPLLALAYVGAGDEGSAVGMLRTAGVSEANIAERIAAIRSRASEISRGR